MSTPLKEFSVNLPITSVGAVGMADVSTPYDVTAGVVVPADVDTSACGHISAFVDSCSMLSYDQADPMVYVDMIVTVNIVNPEDNTSKAYKLVKRLAMDKCKLATEAVMSSPVQVLEAQEDQEEVQREMSAFYAAKRVREMAGIYEARGAKVAQVMFSFDAPEGQQERISQTVTLEAVSNKAHARYVFELKHASMYKNAVITRVTMI